MNKRPSPPAASKLPFDARILDGLPDPVFAVDRKFHIIDANRAARDLLSDEAIGTDLRKSRISSPILKTVETVLAGTAIPTSEVLMPFPVTRSYELNVWRFPGLKSKGPAWAIIVLHDMTSMRKTEQMRADFVSNVSHEMRSPLSSLLGFIETLRGPARDDPEATDRFLKIMEDEAKRMTRLINDLLTLSKVESDEHILPDGQVDLAGLLTQAVNILSVRAQDRGITIGIDIPESASLVIGDADELTQVFQNLIGNAINYGKEETPILVEVKKVNAIPETGVPGFSIAIVNEGAGIRPDDIPRLTERFYRVDKGRSRSMGGTGLGLAIVKHIVARHRGQLAIKSETQKKTCFTVYLPAADNG
ncbi:MAG: PAS domain-containing protein [Rhodospirillaceae bacterium]|mgnify:FL=1|jgi:two-component system phosphate regulon sensor histidine kinase PhoR|nr:PAS domain-containing protein [Alphaproteobacteria bacterium]MBT3549756.1 PAS domain-containing protein [Rhodospirillaceae bacterium]MBT3886590.1 PAS domain-containing protein [Rhodospirillaceae bacterium]MBT4117326.1 PAS domain-containing protein [Rhodospirillaceae bacterium]MBT4673442.1 PAS domain-containing protein [Rhodospirillaceae bacterium]